MKRKETFGPDITPPSFLKLLDSSALYKLLSRYNSSFSFAHCPKIWRVAIIIPLLKAIKSPTEVASFYLISLIPCIVKLLERILADRVYYIADMKNLFSRAGKIRSLL